MLTISGIEFDDPREIPIFKRDIREWREGARTTVKEMWVCSYKEDAHRVWLERVPITMTNRGVCTFGGRQVKDEREKALIKELFEQTQGV
jgi:hypothetical protein